MRPAVFLDRDGTIIEEVGYLSDPDRVVVLPGIPEALRRLAAAGYALVAASNQGGIARGLFSEDHLREVIDRVVELLAGEDARLDAWYHCPHHPDFSGPCECRKPAPGMLLRAAADLDLDVTRSWMVGDHPVDAGAAIAAGARPILVRSGHGLLEGSDEDLGPDVPVVDDLAAAADLILGGRG